MLKQHDLIDRAVERLQHIHPDAPTDRLDALAAVLSERLHGGNAPKGTAAQEALRAQVRAAMNRPSRELATLLGIRAESVRRVLSEFRSPR